MKKFIKNKRVWLAAAVMLAIVTASVGTALAYFTAYTEASGGYFLTLREKTVIEEEVYDKAKHVMIRNTGENDVYLRVKAFVGSDPALKPSYECNGAWELRNDGYFHYITAPGVDAILKVGETIPLEKAWEVHFEDMTKVQADRFSCIIIQEYVPVLYDDKGNNLPANWSKPYKGGA